MGAASQRVGMIFFFFQAEDGIRDYNDWSSDVCSSDLPDLASYARDGFLILEDFLPPADCDALQARAAELVAAFDPGPVRTVFSTRDQGHARDQIGRASCRERV